MRGFRVLWAGATGYALDSLILSPFLVFGTSWPLAGLDNFADLNFSNPIHVLVGLILPVLMTVISGGVAGAMAPEDPRDAGALVGGFGLGVMALASLSDGFADYGPYALAFIIGQCVGTVLAAVAAVMVANYRRRQQA
ncbi:MAG TPA: hypothetical protein VGE07_14460 [Herpetosiphonaceae bacterium]